MDRARDKVGDMVDDTIDSGRSAKDDMTDAGNSAIPRMSNDNTDASKGDTGDGGMMDDISDRAGDAMDRATDR